MLFSVSSPLNAFLAYSAAIKTSWLWSLLNLSRVYVARDSGDHFHRRNAVGVRFVVQLSLGKIINNYVSYLPSYSNAEQPLPYRWKTHEGVGRP